ncbi:DUF721 domain-containing protein [Paracoccus pacificus]|uniref:DUF721 domain-containing protein n=1 Tax=Paracoccus pacificus TaxID=1463598 RepID=A0ABW4R2T7_9RHOB
MAEKATPDKIPPRRRRGFEPAGALAAGRIRDAGEGRGFAIARLLTRWAEVVGDETAARSRPVRVSYPRHGLGATLTLLTTGAQAPLLEMDLPRIRDRVNACYGYNAIARIALTQTAPTGFAEGQAAFLHAAAKRPETPLHDPVKAAQATEMTSGIIDPELREALTLLALNHLSRNDPTARKAGI